MNNRGQSLAIFIIVLPIILLLIAGVVDIGNFLTIKNTYENEVKSTINYGLKHLEDENIYQKISDLLDSNIEGEKEIDIQNETIKIKVKTPVTSVFSNIVSFDYQIDISYIGYMDNDEIIVRKE